MQVYNNFDLTDYNSYRLKSKCKTAYFPESEDDVVALYKSNKRSFYCSEVVIILFYLKLTMMKISSSSMVILIKLMLM